MLFLWIFFYIYLYFTVNVKNLSLIHPHHIHHHLHILQLLQNMFHFVCVCVWDVFFSPPAPHVLPLPVSTVGSQDSLLEITFRSTVPAVICDPTTPKPEVSTVNLPALGASDSTANVFSSSNGTMGSLLGREQCLLKLECFRFLQGPPPPPRPPSPPSGTPEGKGRTALESALLSHEVESLGCLDFARFRESGIASEYESNSNSDDSDDNEDEEDEDEDMEIFGWGTDLETIKLLNVLNRRETPDCLGDEIVV